MARALRLLAAALCLAAAPAFACDFGSTIGGGQCQGYILNGTTTFSVPADWSNTNKVEVIGGGGGGCKGSGGGLNGCSGGGGGGYSQVTNQAGYSGTLTVAVGAGGTGGATGSATA